MSDYPPNGLSEGVQKLPEVSFRIFRAGLILIIFPIKFHENF